MKKFIIAVAFIFASIIAYSQESKWIDSTEFKELSKKYPNYSSMRISPDSTELWIIDYNKFIFFKIDISSGKQLDSIRFNKTNQIIKPTSGYIYYFTLGNHTKGNIPIKIFSVYNDSLIYDDTLKYEIDNPYINSIDNIRLDINFNLDIIGSLDYVYWGTYDNSNNRTKYNSSALIYYKYNSNYSTCFIELEKRSQFISGLINQKYYLASTNKHGYITGPNAYSDSFNYNYFSLYSDTTLIFEKITNESIESTKTATVDIDANWLAVLNNAKSYFTYNIKKHSFLKLNISEFYSDSKECSLLATNYNNLLFIHNFNKFGETEIVYKRFNSPTTIAIKKIKNYFPFYTISYFTNKTNLIFRDLNGTIRMYQFEDVIESVTKINSPKSLVYRLSDTVKLSGITSANTPEIVWDFGDGTNDSNKLSVNHIFKKTGIFLVKLSAKDQNGISFDTISIKIIKDLVPKYDFEFLLSGDTSKVQFHNQSEGDIQKYEWDFADGEKSIETNPIHHYSDKGQYLVKLTAFDEIGSKEYFNNSYVTIKDNQFFSIDSNKLFWKYEYLSDFKFSNFISAIEINPDTILISAELLYIKYSELFTRTYYINLYQNKISNANGYLCSFYIRNFNNNEYYEYIKQHSDYFYTFTNNRSKLLKGNVFLENSIKDDIYEFDNDSLPLIISNFNYNSSIILNRIVSFKPPLRVKTQNLPIKVPLALGFNKIQNEVMMAFMKDSITLKMFIFEHDSLNLIDSVEYKNENILAIYGGCSLRDGYYFTSVLKKDTTKVAAILHFDYNFNLINIEYDFNNNKLLGNVRKLSDTSFVYVGIYNNNKYNFNLYKQNHKKTCYNLLTDSIFSIASITKGIKNSIIVAGNRGNFTNIILKIDFDDYKIPTGFEEKIIQVSPKNLSQNFPNPFNESTCFEFTIVSNCNYNLIVTDIFGNEVYKTSGIAREGLNKIEFQRDNLPLGVYFCKISCGNNIFNYKIMISE